LLGALPPTSACCLDRCAAGIGEAPLEGFLGTTIENEEDDAALVSAGSNPFSSSKEMSLRLRGRIVEVVLLEGKRLSLLFIVAAAADKLDSGTLALEIVDSQISTYQCNANICESRRRVCSGLRVVRMTCGEQWTAAGLEPLVKQQAPRNCIRPLRRFQIQTNAALSPLTNALEALNSRR
jgi:hypothetical protein